MDKRVRPLTKEQQDRLLHTLPVWARERIAALEAEREELLGLLFRASEWLVPDEHSPENMDKLACEINAAIDAARSKP